MAALRDSYASASLAASRVPFAERGGTVRGLLDLATGCYPSFLFGGPLGHQVPVFHFHEVTREWLEPRFRYLAENGYRTITCDEIAQFVDGKITLEPRTVALTFDDAWGSAWSVALPLLKQHGLRATVFAIPGRIADEGRPSPFVTWTQLREMHDSGVFDVQSHTRSHAMVFVDSEALDFVGPSFAQEPLLNRPVASIDLAPAGTANGHVESIGDEALGTPLYARRSRMADGLRYFPDERTVERCRTHVATNGGREFFARPRWKQELFAIEAAGDERERFETDAERANAIRDELAVAREMLNAGLRTTSVKHIALPWGVSGATTRAALGATGHELAFAERPLLRRTVRAGDDRHQLMRLNGKFLTCLPGRGRQWFFTAV